MAYKYTKKQLIDAVEKSNGTYASVARLVKPKCSPITIKMHIEKHPDVQELFNKVRDGLLDEAENVLLESLRSWNPNVALNAATFIAKTIGKEKWGESGNKEIGDKLVDLIDKLISNAESDK